jgi:hypothetical protein
MYSLKKLLLRQGRSIIFFFGCSHLGDEAGNHATRHRLDLVALRHAVKDVGDIHCELPIAATAGRPDAHRRMLLKPTGSDSARFCVTE